MIAELVEKIRTDPEVHTLAEDAFLTIGALLLAGEWRDFVVEAPIRKGDRYQWELAAAFVLSSGRQAIEALETHPFGAADLEARHGPQVLDVLLDADDATAEITDGPTTYRYERHQWLPCWREVGAELCPDHGLPLREVQDWETGQDLRSCPRCFMGVKS